MSNETRREFLQKSFWIFASLPVAGAVLSACTKSPNPSDAGGPTGAAMSIPPGTKPVSEDSNIAVSLGYKHNADKIDAAKWTKKKPDQYCRNCQFYTRVNDFWGNCQIIRDGVVNRDGWCNSWASKQGA